MIVHAYALCWNEEEMLPYYLRHYRSIVDCFRILDDGSTDGSLEILAGEPNIEVGRLKRAPSSFIISALDFYNHGWKRSRGEADWVVVSNIDEHLYHQDLGGYLRWCQSRGVTAIPAKGYQMISDSFPATERRLCEAVTYGMPWSPMDKLCIFRPDAVRDIEYGAGRHAVELAGSVVYPEATEVRLLHYKYLGLDYLAARLAELRTGLGPVDLARGWGHKYCWDAQTVERDFLRVRAAAVRVVPRSGGSYHTLGVDEPEPTTEGVPSEAKPC